jgi:hypothetical protein
MAHREEERGRGSRKGCLEDLRPSAGLLEAEPLPYSAC